MNNKRYILAVAAGLIGLYLFWPGDDTPDAVKRVSNADSDNRGAPAQARLEPTARTYESPPARWLGKERYERALQPSYGGGVADQRYGQVPEPSVSRGYGYDNGPSSSVGYPLAQETYDPTEGYRFRPLSDSEKRRLGIESPAKYEAPAYRAPEPAPAAPSYGTRPVYPQRGFGGYSFRPLEQAPGAAGRWQGPYPDPAWAEDRGFVDRHQVDPSPQWGATPPPRPPIHQMYPSLDLAAGRTLSAR